MKLSILAIALTSFTTVLASAIHPGRSAVSINIATSGNANLLYSASIHPTSAAQGQCETSGDDLTSSKIDSASIISAMFDSFTFHRRRASVCHAQNPMIRLSVPSPETTKS